MKRESPLRHPMSRPLVHLACLTCHHGPLTVPPSPPARRPPQRAGIVIRLPPGPSDGFAACRRHADAAAFVDPPGHVKEPRVACRIYRVEM